MERGTVPRGGCAPGVVNMQVAYFWIAEQPYLAALGHWSTSPFYGCSVSVHMHAFWSESLLRACACLHADVYLATPAAAAANVKHWCEGIFLPLLLSRTAARNTHQTATRISQKTSDTAAATAAQNRLSVNTQTWHSDSQQLNTLLPSWLCSQVGH